MVGGGAWRADGDEVMHLDRTWGLGRVRGDGAVVIIAALAAAMQAGCSCPVSRVGRELATDAAAAAGGGVAGVVVVREGRKVVRGTIRVVRAIVPGL
jgi:hypothetical protein